MKYTSEVFQRLSHGQFISANSIMSETRAIYNDIEDNEKEYADYFSQIDFQLESGDGYYYFARNEQKVVIENKLRTFLVWIDYLDFLTSCDSTFGADTQFTLAQMEVRVGSDVELKDKLANIFEEKTSTHDKLYALATTMTNQGFAELVSEEEGMYQVTNAFRYITHIIDCINIDEEVKDEIPE